MFEENFGIDQNFGENRFADHLPDDFEGAKAAYDAESPVQVLVESGADTNPVGTTGERVRWDFDQYPPKDAKKTTWYFDDDRLLSDAAPSGRAQTASNTNRIPEGWRPPPQAPPTFSTLRRSYPFTMSRPRRATWWPTQHQS